MVSDFPLRASLNGLREKMLVDFREVTAQIEHRGARGHEREALIAREYLQDYVPRTLDIVHGAEIVDTDGNGPAECDLVVQSAATPPLMLGEAFYLVPVKQMTSSEAVSSPNPFAAYVEVSLRSHHTERRSSDSRAC